MRHDAFIFYACAVAFMYICTFNIHFQCHLAIATTISTALKPHPHLPKAEKLGEDSKVIPFNFLPTAPVSEAMAPGLKHHLDSLVRSRKRCDICWLCIYT